MPTPYEVALTPDALADLDRLDQFLRDKNPKAADRMLAAIDAGLTRLCTMPLVGRPVRASSLRALIVRFGQGSYVCLYEVRGALVLVARVFHGREDWTQRD
jgi:addiction module RelE/StbE family toxin